MLKTKWILIACALQFILIGAMFISAYLPLYFGTEVKIIAKGYDPRDLLAGNFVQLEYEEIGLEGRGIPPNKEVFVTLKPTKEGIYIFQEVLTKAPKNQLYIKARISDSYYSRHLNFPKIEKYFAPKDKAQELEKTLSKPNQQAIVTLKILRGEARITDLEVKPTNINSR